MSACLSVCWFELAKTKSAKVTNCFVENSLAALPEPPLEASSGIDSLIRASPQFTTILGEVKSASESVNAPGNTSSEAPSCAAIPCMMMRASSSNVNFVWSMKCSDAPESSSVMTTSLVIRASPCRNTINSPSRITCTEPARLSTKPTASSETAVLACPCSCSIAASVFVRSMKYDINCGENLQPSSSHRTGGGEAVK